MNWQSWNHRDWYLGNQLNYLCRKLKELIADSKSIYHFLFFASKSFIFFFASKSFWFRTVFICLYFLARSMSSFSFLKTFKLTFYSSLNIYVFFLSSSSIFYLITISWVSVSFSTWLIFFLSISNCSFQCWLILDWSSSSATKNYPSFALSWTTSAWYSSSFFFKYSHYLWSSLY